jgi:hypothetical protein
MPFSAKEYEMKPTPQGKKRRFRRSAATNKLQAKACPSSTGCVEVRPKLGGHAFKKKRSFSVGR